MTTNALQPYNGHRSWNAWNVSLWIANDEPIYRMALEAKRSYPSLKSAACYLQRVLPRRTPDGAVYSLSAITEAIREL